MPNTCSGGRDFICCRRNPSVCTGTNGTALTSHAILGLRQGGDARREGTLHPGFHAVSRTALDGSIALPLPSKLVSRLRVCVTLVGPAIVPCDCDQRMARCVVLDAGSYRVLFDDGMKARAIQEINVTTAGAGALSPYPQHPCQRSGMPARWVRRDAMCPNQGGAALHPLCAVPAAEGGWQLVPHTCYYRGWSEQELSVALGDMSLLFVGDSTQRFLWGAFGNLLEANSSHRFQQVGYGSQASPKLSSGSFAACDRFGLNVLRPVGGATLTYTQLIYEDSLRRLGSGVAFDPATDTFSVFKKGSHCTVRVHDAWASLERYMRIASIDVVLLQLPTHERACNAPHNSATTEPGLLQLLPLLYAYQPNASLSRRGVTGWDAASVGAIHCLRRSNIEQLEADLRVAPRPAVFGANDEEWRRFARHPFEMYRDTAAIHMVEPSDGVHVARGVNVVFAHVLATHILGLRRGERGIKLRGIAHR